MIVGNGTILIYWKMKRQGESEEVTVRIKWYEQNYTLVPVALELVSISTFYHGSLLSMESTKKLQVTYSFPKALVYILSFLEVLKKCKGRRVVRCLWMKKRCCSAWVVKSLYFKGNIRSIEHAFLDMLFHHSRTCSVQLTLLHGFFPSSLTKFISWQRY